MPASPAARLSDLHECPLSGGPILPTCSLNVRTNMLPAARVGDFAGDAEGPDEIIEGSPTVRINSKLAVRVGDHTLGGGKIAEGSPNVRIGGGSRIDAAPKAVKRAPAPPTDLNAKAEQRPEAPPPKVEPTLQPAGGQAAWSLWSWSYWGKVWGGIKDILSSILFWVLLVVSVIVAFILGWPGVIAGLLLGLAWTTAMRLYSLWKQGAPWYKWVIYVGIWPLISGWDALGLTGLFEGSFGYDFVTWRKLSEDEAAQRMAGGIVGLVMLIVAWGVGKLWPRPAATPKAAPKSVVPVEPVPSEPLIPGPPEPPPSSVGDIALEGEPKPTIKDLAGSVKESQEALGRAQDAHAKLMPKSRYDGKTVGSDGDKTISGWKPDKPAGFTSASPSRIKAYSDQIGHELRPDMRDNLLKPDGTPDPDAFPGRYYASHADKQLAITNPGEPMAFDNPICKDCFAFFQKNAAATRKPQIVTDPECTRIFMPDGTVVLPDGTPAPPARRW
jgi:uncharacterized Zn-binding protein involved in type VI secretion